MHTSCCSSTSICWILWIDGVLLWGLVFGTVGIYAGRLGESLFLGEGLGKVVNGPIQEVATFCCDVFKYLFWRRLSIVEVFDLVGCNVLVVGRLEGEGKSGSSGAS